MSDIIKLDKSASDDFKKKMKQIREGLNESGKQLGALESSVKQLHYADMGATVSRTRSEIDKTAEKLNEFEHAYDEYVYEVEQFDRKSARLLENIPEITEWTAHSGWTADPNAVQEALMEKLVRDGVVNDMNAARE